jgi:hypothetical protein
MVHGGGRNRDGWCTARWLAEALGRFKFDPCSNEYSHIDAELRCVLNWGSDGLVEGHTQGEFDNGYLEPPLTYALSANVISGVATEYWDTFINPPYSRGQVMRWIKHYEHTNFTMLLRWDPSTTWFKYLMRKSRWVWFANRRIQFEPPPGVTGSKNPFPHALIFREKPNLDRWKRLNELGRFAFVYRPME